MGCSTAISEAAQPPAVPCIHANGVSDYTAQFRIYLCHFCGVGPLAVACKRLYVHAMDRDWHRDLFKLVENSPET